MCVVLHDMVGVKSDLFTEGKHSRILETHKPGTQQANVKQKETKRAGICSLFSAAITCIPDIALSFT